MVKKSWMMLMDGLGKIAAGIDIVSRILRPGRGVPFFWEFSQVRWPEIFHLPAISFPPSNLFHQTTSTHKHLHFGDAALPSRRKHGRSSSSSYHKA